MESIPKKVLIVGLGRIGQFWKSLVEEVPAALNLIGTVDPFNEEATYKTFDEELLELCDGILVCSPTATHAEFVVSALRKNKFVLCEKPLCSEDEEIKRCFSEVKVDHQLLVGLNRRWDERIFNLRNSNPSTVSIDCRDFPEPPDSFLKHSGGVYVDCLIHEFDILQFALGFDGSDTKITLVDQHTQDNETKSEESRVEFIKSATVVLGNPSGNVACVRFCRRFADRYVHTITLDNGKKLDPGLQPGASFIDRFKPAFQSLLATFIRIMNGEANGHDIARIPTVDHCLNLNRLCSECVK